MVRKGFGFWTLLVVALTGVAGCGQSEPTPAQKAAQAQRQQRAEAEAEARQRRAEAEAAAHQRRAEAEAAEAGLMADLRIAAPELKRRLAERVRRSGRLLIVGPVPGASQFSITAMPLSTPWAVECSSSGLSVTLGGWSSGEVSEGSGEISSDFVLSLTGARLSEELCAEFVSLIGEALVELVKSPDR